MKLYLSSYRQGDQSERFLDPNAPNDRVAVIQNAQDCWTDPVKRKSVLDREYEGLISLGLEPEELDLRKYFGRQDELREETPFIALHDGEAIVFDTLTGKQQITVNNNP